ncbi:MAG: N-acetylmuramoyl-L-alanine amidase [Rhodospirillales bacterium]|nr:N-acetylmuramoyl-L-alanine amidase [Rhodospirillales bacterium]
MVSALVLVLGLGLASAGIPAAHAQSKPLVSDIRAAENGERTRFVLELDRPVAFTVFPLADPYRVVIDLPEVGWQLPGRPLPAGIGLMERLRYGLFQPGTTRVVLDMKAPVAIERAFWLDPDAQGRHRLVVDIGRIERDAMIAGLREAQVKVAPDKTEKSAGTPGDGPSAASPAARMAGLTPPPPPSPAAPPAASKSPRQISPPALADTGEDGASEKKSAQEAALPAAAEPEVAPFGAPPRQPLSRRAGGKRIIVVDPGHGGPDPGTIGVQGTYEKHITLAMAKEIKIQLEQTGRYKVVLTRDRDIFLRLRDRVAHAREAEADLFLSIHADSIADGAARGPSVYTLSEKASDREAAELAEKENKADVIAGLDLSHETPEVGSILIDLAQRETMNRSAHFAAGLVGEFRKEASVLRNTHRFAGFAVLKAPDVPSVLVELGFLSNPAEEKALASRAYRVKLAQAIARATDRFFTRVEEAKRH